MKQNFQNDPQFNIQDQETWKTLYSKQSALRKYQIIPEFSKGLELLEITEKQIPKLNNVNAHLKSLTGWEAVYVKGFEGPETFFKLLAHRQFPIGSFIRDAKDLSYTPEPDIFHDLYGHIPFYTISEYAKFCEQFGLLAMKYIENPKILEEFQRLFWFTIEFGLIQTKMGLKIFGAGIASSFSECDFALSTEPELIDFDLNKIRHQEFRIDIMQKKLFVLKSQDQLYSCLNEFERIVENEYRK